mgnify:CR=1
MQFLFTSFVFILFVNIHVHYIARIKPRTLLSDKGYFFAVNVVYLYFCFSVVLYTYRDCFPRKGTREMYFIEV